MKKILIIILPGITLICILIFLLSVFNLNTTSLKTKKTTQENSQKKIDKKSEPVKEILVKKQTKVIEITDCKNPKEYIDLLNCIDSLTEVSLSLKSMTVISPKGQTQTGVEYLLNIINHYNGASGFKQKEYFFNDYIEPYIFNYVDDKKYIARVIHMLWYEKNKNPQWSLRDYSKQEVASIVWVNFLHGHEANFPKREQNNFTDSSYNEWDTDSLYKLYPLALQFIKPDQEQTIKNVLRWQKKNFFHAYYEYTWNVYLDDPEQKWDTLPKPETIEDLFNERVTGCHENTFLFVNLLRSINIPAIYYADYWGHGIVYLPSIDKYVHGDHIADFVAVTPDSILIDREELHKIDYKETYYSSIIQDKFLPPNHLISNLELHRKGDSLHLETNSVCGEIEEKNANIINKEVPEFNVTREPNSCLTKSNLVPIKSLEQLVEGK